jgi:branched-subunit amino acid transport protein
MILLAAASWVLRSLFVVVVPAARLPRPLRDSLRHLAPAVLAALVTVEVAAAAQGLDAMRAAVLLGSVVLAGVAVRVTGNRGLAVFVGVGAALLLDLVLV